MYTSVLILISCSILACGITVLEYSHGGDIVGKIKIPLEPLRVECSPSDIIILSAPIISGRKPVYYLYNPRGEFRKLDISPPNYTREVSQYDMISVKTIKDTGFKIINAMDNYEVFNVNFGMSILNPEDHFAERIKKMDANDFMIGPVTEDDYGNWVLSAFFKNDQNEWVEVEQSIAIDIIEVIPADPPNSTLKVGDTFNLRFAYPVNHLESCQLIAPKTAFDRFYDRSRIQPDTCGYVLGNVTSRDSGVWKLIGVGRITYFAMVHLDVLP